MPRSASSNPIGGSVPAAGRLPPRWAAATVCVLLGLLLAVAFADYSPAQSRFFNTHPTEHNIVGEFGAYASWVAYSSLGWAAWLAPVFLVWASYLALRNARRLTPARVIAMLACVGAGSGLLSAMFDGYPRGTNFFPQGPGGALGRLVYERICREIMGDFGTVVLLGAVYVVGLLFVFTKDIGAELDQILSHFSEWRAARARAREAAAARVVSERSREPEPLVLESVGPANKNVLVPRSGGQSIVAPPESERRPPFVRGGDEKAARTLPALNIVKPEEPRKARGAAPVPADDDTYRFPPLTILKEQVRVPAASSEEEHRRNAENLLRILGEFGVEVSLGEIHVGPVITRYEVVPAPGVRVEKISGLDKNIALGMRAQSVRILAPIPGKAAVGVEVPNQNSTPVGLREILESEDWVSAKAEIPIALGKDVSGKPLVSDLTKMPHLLIAGATGSGKSVCINAIISSILYSKSPRDLRMILVDPKVVELKVFNNLPHMLIPVLTDPRKVPAALKWLLTEMEQRYQIFAKANVRNIHGFNHRKKGAAAPAAEPIQPALEGLDPMALDDGIEMPEHLPYIVVIIDELADLMMVAPAEIETNVARLAQLARGAGIHIIIATQRPSVDVITGLIKANLPSRIAFQVASQVDSRTIIDYKGADTLIGRGDMLFTPPGTSRIVRAQGAFVSDDEVMTLVEYLKQHNAPPAFAHDVQARIDRAAKEDEEDGGDGDDDDLGDDDELFRQALDVLKSTRRASTSMLQRRLRIGYNRAARIMEIMEEKGIVGPENGSSPREILVDLDTY